MKSNIIKRGVAGLLSLVMCISTFVGLVLPPLLQLGNRPKFISFLFREAVIQILITAELGGHPNLHYMNGWNSVSPSSLSSEQCIHMTVTYVIVH